MFHHEFKFFLVIRLNLIFLVLARLEHTDSLLVEFYGLLLLLSHALNMGLECVYHRLIVQFLDFLIFLLLQILQLFVQLFDLPDVLTRVYHSSRNDRCKVSFCVRILELLNSVI